VPVPSPGVPWGTLQAISATGIQRLRDILAKTVEDKLPHAQKLSDPFAAGSKISDLETPTPIGTASAKSPPEALA